MPSLSFNNLKVANDKFGVKRNRTERAQTVVQIGYKLDTNLCDFHLDTLELSSLYPTQQYGVIPLSTIPDNATSNLHSMFTTTLEIPVDVRFTSRSWNISEHAVLGDHKLAIPD